MLVLSLAQKIQYPIEPYLINLMLNNTIEITTVTKNDYFYYNSHTNDPNNNRLKLLAGFILVSFLDLVFLVKSHFSVPFVVVVVL